MSTPIELPPLEPNDQECEQKIEPLWKSIPQHLSQARLWTYIGYYVCRERQLLEALTELAQLRAEIAKDKWISVKEPVA